MKSGKMQRYPFDAIRERLRAHPRDALDFAFGRQTDETPQELLDLLRDSSALALQRGRPEDLSALNETIAEWMRRWFGVDLATDAILPVPGGRLAVGALIGALLEPGDRVVVTEPTYPVFARLAAGASTEVLTAELDPDRSFAPDLTAFGEAARLVALNYPNNPTGALLDQGDLARLRAGAAPGTIWFNDATYGPLTHDGRPVSLLAGTDPTQLLELHSLAKFFDLGPWPVAFLVGDPSLLTEIRRFTGFAWSPLSALHLRVARHCLEDEHQLETVRSTTAARLDRLQRVVSGLGFRTFPARGGIYLLSLAPAEIGGREVACAGDAAERLLSEHDVAVVPWEVAPHGYLRWSSAYGDEELEALEQRGADGPLAVYR